MERARTEVVSPHTATGDVTCDLDIGTAYEFYQQLYANTTTIAGAITFTGKPFGS